MSHSKLILIISLYESYLKVPLWLTLRIVLVEPQHPGNIGAVARAMANFGLTDFVLHSSAHLGTIEHEWADERSTKSVNPKLRTNN